MGATKVFVFVLVAALAVGFGAALEPLDASGGTVHAPASADIASADLGTPASEVVSGTGADPLIQPGRNCGPSKDLTGAEKSRNAQFARWLNVEHAIHVLAGYEGSLTHDVGRGQSMVIGFEFTGAPGSDPAALDAAVTDNPLHQIRVRLNGVVQPGDFKEFYQPAFEAATFCGPNWSWDHDSDGPGDGNGNGVDDFNQVVLFWRAPLGPIGVPGTYVLQVQSSFDGGITWATYPGGVIVVR